MTEKFFLLCLFYYIFANIKKYGIIEEVNVILNKNYDLIIEIGVNKMRNFDGFAYDRLSPAWLKRLIRDNEYRWQNFSDEQVMRWLYLELGKRFSFSREYRYAITAKEKGRIESQARDVVMRSRRINNTDEVICIDIEQAMQMVLNDVFGIDSNVVIDGSGPHVYLETRTENYGRVRSDLQEDLANIKAGRRTEHFACESCYDGRNFSTIPQNVTEQMDKELGYIGEDGQYMEDQLERFREKINDSKTLDERVRKVFVLLEHKFAARLKLMKYCERTELYKKAMEDMIPDAKIGHRTFRENGKLLSCFIVPGSDDEEERYYLFNKEKRIYEEIDTEKYKKFYDDNDQVIKEATDSDREPRVDE